MLQMDDPTNLQKGTFAQRVHTIPDAYTLLSYWSVLAQPPMHTPSWLSTKIMVDLLLWNPHCDPLSQFTKLLEHHQDTQFLYLDGSKKVELVGYAVTSSSQIIQQCVLPSSLSIFSSELQAILLAIQHITQNFLQCGII